jgi:hypothetical protein
MSDDKYTDIVSDGGMDPRNKKTYSKDYKNFEKHKKNVVKITRS